MDGSMRHAATAVAIAMLLSVFTQAFYFFVVSAADPETVLRPITWMVEAAVFGVIAVAGLALAARSAHAPLAWSAIALGGLLNLLQVGVGLSMFPPATSVRAELPQLLESLLSGAFFLYFTGKVLFALAAIGFGRACLGAGGAMSKGVGGAAMAAGAIAALLNIYAMAAGPDAAFVAGLSGTIATFLLVPAILLAPRGDGSSPLHGRTA